MAATFPSRLSRLLVLDIMPAGAAVRDEDGGGACQAGLARASSLRRAGPVKLTRCRSSIDVGEPWRK